MRRNRSMLMLWRGALAFGLATMVGLPPVGAQVNEDAPAAETAAETAAPERLFHLTFAPQGNLPVGSRSEFHSFGGGGSISGHLQLPSLSWLVPTLEVGYGFAPVVAPDADVDPGMDLSLVRLSAGAELAWRLGERIALYGFGTGGGFYGFLTGEASGDAFGLAYRTGAGLSFRVTPAFGLTAGAAFSSFPGLLNGVSAFVGTRLTFGDSDGFDEGPRIRIHQPEFDTIFPVLFKYYDSNPLGTVRVENVGNETLEQVEVRVDVPQYMDTPKVSARVDELKPGETREVELTALLTNEVLTITEGTKVAANVVAGHEGAEEPVSTSATLSTYDRNALQWDDDRKIAAFVTSRDDEVQSFAKNVASLSRERRIDAVNQELQLAMAQYAAIVEHGTSYVIDPTSSYEELSQNPMAVDYVQFPRQTLQFRAGDCDDLSATYCSLLQSVGIDTAFITIPGHIYMAFRLDMSAEEARRAFSRPEDLIIQDDGSVWVPVETTVLDDGFNEAWAIGARQWREHNPKGNAGFFRTGEAWSTYQPVAFSVSDTEIVLPRNDDVAAQFQAELDQFVNRELHSREQRYVRRLQDNPGDVRTRNRLAVLYGRYGKYDQAREQLEDILDRRSGYAPALVNLGNIEFMAQQYRAAHGYYEQALEAAPRNDAALLGAARAANQLENFNEAERRYERLASANPELAQRYSHLAGAADGDGARASGAQEVTQSVVWEESR